MVTIGRPPASLTYAPEGHFEKRLIILELSQQFSLEREAFLAQLHLRNGLPVPLKDITVDITISDRLGELSEQVIIRSPNTPMEQTKPFALNIPSEAIFSGALTSIPETWMQSSLTNFIIVPDTTTSLPDIQAHGNYMATWTIVPDAIGIVDPRGVDFYLKATINYTPEGQTPAPTIETVPAKITVRPQPLVILDYFLPTYVLGGETFNWTVIVTNVGQGVARNLNIHTPQPIIVDALGDPVNFTILGAQNHRLVELEPGESHELIFQIRPEENGAFAGAHANCEQQNYQGVTLPPLLYCSPTIHWLDTSYLYYAHQQTLAKEGCFTTLHQAFMGDPVNTYSGNFTLPVTDVSIPTWGLPLQFERTYNALTQDDPGPLGQGWTHNYHASIEYRPYISRNEAGELISENLLSARLPHGSRIYFTVNQNGDISPMPGVRAQLTEELGVYTLTQECDQTTYIFENKTFTNPYARPDAVLTAIIDADGNTTTFTYDPDEGNLTSVIAPSGRELTFTYTQQDDHWYLETMSDPLGRLWEY
ncbi:MAG: RHS repeat protein, partial [Anaerolineales bacterium]|nr:RHS repeat protein [Anaerolineales bacterium]